MNLYKINYTYVPNGSGKVSRGDVKVGAATPEAARAAFHDTHQTDAGWYAITSTEAIALGELF